MYSLNAYWEGRTANLQSFDALVGLAMLGIATAVFCYYSVWVLILPFVDETHFIARYFPPREWAIWLPAMLLVAGVAVVGTFIGFVMIKSERKRQAKLAAKKTQ